MHLRPVSPEIKEPWRHLIPWAEPTGLSFLTLPKTGLVLTGLQVVLPIATIGPTSRSNSKAGGPGDWPSKDSQTHAGGKTLGFLWPLLKEIGMK